jgi:hypothetical protein
MYLSSKKIIVVFGICASTCYLIYTATDQEYTKAIADYNSAFNIAFSLWQMPPATRPLNWQDNFTDAVTTARRLFTAITLYWEHDKRTLPARNRASKQLMNITAISGQPKATNAVQLLAQHEKILAQLEAEIQKLAGSRSALQKTINNIKNLVSTGLQNIYATLGLASNSLNQANYAATQQYFNQAQQEINQLLNYVNTL